MIGRLTGIIDEKDLNSIILDVHGVGYELLVPQSTMAKIGHVSEKARLHVYTHVREDAIVLFGFSSGEEKDLFQVILGVSGVGPKLALAILSDLKPDTFKRAIVNNDIKQLSKVSGVGKRTAERLVVELKGKFKLPDTVDEAPVPGGAVPDDVYSESLAALQALGYTLVEAEGAVARASQILDQNKGIALSTQALVSQALKVIR